MKTDRLVQAIREDYEAEGKPCTMIAGDVNADIADVPSLGTLITEEGWHDAGTHPSAINAQGHPVPTCRPEGSKAPTRRDYAFLNQGGLPASSR